MQLHLQEFRQGWRAEGQARGQHVESHDAHRVDIGAPVEQIAADDFRGEVRRRTLDVYLLVLRRTGDTEIRQLDVAIAIENDIRRFDVAVNDAFIAVIVRVVQCAGNLGKYIASLRNIESAVFFEAGGQILAL